MASEPPKNPDEGERQPDDDRSLSQDDIDSLLSGSESQSADNPEPDALPEESDLTQEALDELLQSSGGDMPSAADLTDDTPLADSGLDAPLGRDESDSAFSGSETNLGDELLGDEDVEALLQSSEADEQLADTTPSPSEAEASAAEVEEAMAALEEQMRQEGVTAEPDEEPPVPDEIGSENLAAAVHDETSDEGSDEDALLTQDMLDSLIDQARREREEAAEARPTEEAAPAAQSEPPRLEEEGGDDEEGLLSELIPAPESGDSTASEEERAQEPAPVMPDKPEVPEGPREVPPEAPAPESKRKKKGRRAGLALPRLAPRNASKVIAALLAGIMAATGVYVYGTLFPTRGANLRALNRISAPPLEEVVPQARELVALEKYGEAVDLLEPSIRNAESGPLLATAEFLRIEALYNGLQGYATDTEIQNLLRSIDQFTVDNPQDPRTAQALRWRGRLYERQAIPYAARQAYEQILMDFPEAQDRDALRFDVGRLSLDLGRAYDAIDSLRRLLQETPSSPYAAEAKLMLGDAHLAAGERTVARTIYEQVADVAPNSAVGGQAFGRLGRMAFEEGRYEDTIALMEERRTRATTIDGNDEVFLLLGRSYRATGQLAEAERVLRELIDFFPESVHMPKAFDELAQVLEARGRRDEALQVARQAAERYPNNADALHGAADLLAETGQHRAAAEKYLEAESAGARNPGVLLAAARQYEEAGFTNSAADVYRRAAELYPASPEAVQASIAYARLLNQEGSTEEAIDRLESIALTMGPGPERLPVIRSLARIYRDLGADTRAAEYYAEVAAMSNEPALLAEAAITLLDARRWAEGFALAARVEADKLAPDKAYAFLMAQAEAYLRTNPNRAVLLMEEARDTYPDQRTEQGDKLLFRTYLATDQPARARTMLTELRTKAAEEPIYARQLRDRAIAWGDYSYDRRDFREAADAYATVLDAPGSASQDVHWARFQRANSLMELGDIPGALAIYDGIADSPSPWAEDAQLKADQVRLEQRLRHEPVTPVQTQVAEG